MDCDTVRNDCTAIPPEKLVSAHNFELFFFVAALPFNYMMPCPIAINKADRLYTCYLSRHQPDKTSST